MKWRKLKFPKKRIWPGNATITEHRQSHALRERVTGMTHTNTHARTHQSNQLYMPQPDNSQIRKDTKKTLPRGATGLSAVCDCGISWSYSLTIYNWTVTCNFQQCGILTSVDSDEPVQPPDKLRIPKCCSVGSSTLIKCMQATSKGSDQTTRKRRLIWGFAGRTYHIVGNLMSRLNFLCRYFIQFYSILKYYVKSEWFLENCMFRYHL